MLEPEVDPKRACDTRILFRSITPLPKCSVVPCSALVSIEGTRTDEDYKVEIVHSSGWEQARQGLLKYWSAEQLSSDQCLLSHASVIGVCKWFLVIDNYLPDTPDNQTKLNSLLSVELQGAAENALLLHHDALGPYIERTWHLRSPFRGVGTGRKNVSMNPFRCKRSLPVPSFAAGFERIFTSLLECPWEGSQLARVLDMALDMLSGSLRTLNEQHSFVLLTMAFETLFSKCESDWAGGSQRLARLGGTTKGEVGSAHRFLNNGEKCVRKLRNGVVHGDLSTDLLAVKEARLRFASLVAQATIFLINNSESIGGDDYYSAMESLAKRRFESLPTN